MTSSVLKTIATIIYIIVCIAIVIVVLMQEGKQAGLSGAIKGAADTYWTKNKGRSAEGVLVKITRVLAVLFVALSVVLCTTWLD